MSRHTSSNGINSTRDVFLCAIQRQRAAAAGHQMSVTLHFRMQRANTTSPHIPPIARMDDTLVQKAAGTLLLPVTTTPWGLEYSVHGGNDAVPRFRQSALQVPPTATRLPAASATDGDLTFTHDSQSALVDTAMMLQRYSLLPHWTTCLSFPHASRQRCAIPSHACGGCSSNWPGSWLVLHWNLSVVRGHSGSMSCCVGGPSCMSPACLALAAAGSSADGREGGGREGPAAGTGKVFGRLGD